MTSAKQSEPDPRWQALFPDRAALEDHVNQWQLSEPVAGGVSYVMQVARSLIMQSYFTYDFALPAVTWAMLAMERCLSGCVNAVLPQPLPDNVRLEVLICKAEQCGLLNEQEAAVLHGVRELRNQVIHGALFPTFPPAEALDIVGNFHEAISDIYSRAALMAATQANANRVSGPVTDSMARPLSQRAADVRYAVTWQWTAVKMQYERLMTRSQTLADPLTREFPAEYMRGVIDMDLFVTAIRRLLRAAEQARASGCDSAGALKLPIKAFKSRWGYVITVRDALEHFDGKAARDVALLPMRSYDGWKMVWRGRPVDVLALFTDAEVLCKAISAVIDPPAIQDPASPQPTATA